MPLKEVHRFPNGTCLYMEDNGVGGRRYWSDAIGGGVCVWDTSLVSSDELVEALAAELRGPPDETPPGDPKDAPPLRESRVPFLMAIIRIIKTPRVF